MHVLCWQLVGFPCGRLSVQVHEEGQHLLVFFDVLDAVSAVAEPLCGAVAAQLFDEVVRSARDFLRELDHVDPLQDDVVRFHWV